MSETNLNFTQYQTTIFFKKAERIQQVTLNGIQLICEQKILLSN